MEPREPNTTHTTVIEKRGGGGTVIIGIALLIAVLVGAYFLMNMNRNEAIETEAVTDAARSVGDAADKAGDAVEKAVPGE
ncbi:hypothetical protein ACPVPU_08085 [Sphingomonas sp. CJ99]